MTQRRSKNSLKRTTARASKFSFPYQHWQNVVEHDVQTVIHNMSAVLHTNEFITAMMWSFALRHTRLFNDTPLSSSGYLSPNQLCDINHYVDASVCYRFAFGDLLIYPLKKHERHGKLDVKNDFGFYFGYHPEMKDGVWMYMPYYNYMLPRAGVTRINVQLLHWYGKRVDVHKSTLIFGEFRKGLLQLVQFTFQEEDGIQPNNAPKITEGSDDEQYSSDDLDTGDSTDDDTIGNKRRTDEPSLPSLNEHTVVQTAQNTSTPRRAPVVLQQYCHRWNCPAWHYSRTQRISPARNPSSTRANRLAQTQAGAHRSMAPRQHPSAKRIRTPVRRGCSHAHYYYPPRYNIGPARRGFFLATRYHNARVCTLNARTNSPLLGYTDTTYDSTARRGTISERWRMIPATRRAQRRNALLKRKRRHTARGHRETSIGVCGAKRAGQAQERPHAKTASNHIISTQRGIISAQHAEG